MRPDDRVLVTVGRVAEMLRVTRQAVRKFRRRGELSAEARVEGTQGRPQFLFRKGEVRRFAAARAEQWTRRPPTYGPQLALPLRAPAPAARPPVSWRLAQFRPRMLRMGRQAKPMVVDRQLKVRETLKQTIRRA